MAEAQPAASHAPISTGRDAHALAVSLDPVLHAQCAGHLGPIEWFRSAWQRGGSATGFSTWRLDGGRVIDVVVKLPVGPAEHRWSTRLGLTPAEAWFSPESESRVTPRIIAEGLALGAYDFAWLIMERLPGTPIAAHPSPEHIHELLAAAADFQSLTIAAEPVGPANPTPNWAVLLERSKDVARKHMIGEASRWLDALKRTARILPLLIDRWSRRPVNAWCHGDLHGGNAMHRPCNDGRPTRCVLIDLALVHPGHWVEDALYLERQFWGHPEIIAGIKPVSELGRLRRERGLPANDNYADLANVRRALMAAAAPGVVDSEGGSPKYLRAALDILERVLPQIH